MPRRRLSKNVDEYEILIVTTLFDIRRDVSADSRAVLDRALSHHLLKSEPIPVRELDLEIGKRKVEDAVRQLGGSVIYEQQTNGKRCYELTQLGILLTSSGTQVEGILQRFFQYVRTAVRTDRTIEVISRRDIEKILRFNGMEMNLLRLALERSPHYRFGVSFGGRLPDDGWMVRINDDIGSLMDIDDGRLVECMEELVLMGYDPKSPITELERSTQALHGQRTAFDFGGHVLGSLTKSPIARTSLEFIRENTLRNNLQEDLVEAALVHQSGAWKSCVMLCGCLIEGVLLDSLTHRELEATACALKLGIKEPSMAVWGLDPLLRVAESIGALSKGTTKLAHGIREFRNLVHPGKELRDESRPGKEAADIAMKVVELVIKDCQSRRLQSGA